ncbi:MAG: hypothetical protein WC865_05510 [Bacteroidales bacterium]
MKNFDLYQDKIGTWDKEHGGYFNVDQQDDQIFYSRRPATRFRNSNNRSAWHNEQHREERCGQSAENTLIRKNRMILKKLFIASMGFISIPMIRLTELGFSDKAPSKTELVKGTGHYIFYYYDYGMEPIENGQKAIIHSKKTEDGNHTTELH